MHYVKMQDVLENLAQHGKNVFSLQDATRIMNKPKGYVSKVLASNKRVKRIENGKYFLNMGNVPDLYEIASQIIFPSYVSMFASFQFYSLTEQTVSRYSVISIKRHRPISIEEYVIEFKKIQKRRFFGYKKFNNAYVALVEKAIVDSIYMGSPPISYVEEAFMEAYDRNMIDKDLLIDFTIKMKSISVARKISNLLRSKGLSQDRLRDVLK